MFASPDLRCEDMLYDDVVNEPGSALVWKCSAQFSALISVPNNKMTQKDDVAMKISQVYILSKAFQLSNSEIEQTNRFNCTKPNQIMCR